MRLFHNQILVGKIYFSSSDSTKLQINKVRLTMRDSFASGGYGFSVKICDQAKAECCFVSFGDMYKGDSFVRNAIDACAKIEVTKTSTPTVIDRNQHIVARHCSYNCIWGFGITRVSPGPRQAIARPSPGSKNFSEVSEE